MLKKKLEKKEKFDEMYDMSKNIVKNDEFNWSEQMNKVSEIERKNKTEFLDLKPAERYAVQGFIPGLYLRIEIHNVPCELVENFNSKIPLIIGGLLPNETQLGVLKARFIRHRWNTRVLKNGDPFIISIGWRRYQTIPIFGVEDNNTSRFRMIK